jgi:hypothetical protein
MNKSTAIRRSIGLMFSRRNDLLKEMFKVVKELWSKNEVIKKYNLSKGLPSVSLLELFPEFDETVKSYSYLDGTSKAIDIAFIKQVVKNRPNAAYIEFGSWRGESLVNICPEVKDCYSITFDKKMTREFGYSEDAINAVDHFTKDMTDLHRIYHNSQTYDFKDLHGKFDVVFVDADHEYPGVKIDTSNAYKLLKDENSILIWHDYGRSYETVNWQVLHGMLDGMPAGAHQHMYKVQNTICAIYTKQNLQGKYRAGYLPERTFTVSIKAEKN